jgi:AraC-like DNA-binding protein
MQYLAQWRMHMAALRLRDGRSSIAQIGFDIGYTAEAAFSRAFKRQFGISPAAWRKQSV